MHLTDSLCAIPILLLAILAILLVITSFRRPIVAAPRSTVEDIHALLSPPHTTTAELLHSRAIRNTRLVQAFGITSTFVSADPVVHHDFRCTAQSVINAATKHGWLDWQTAAVEAVDAYLPQTEIDFDDYMRAVTFTVVIVGLLGVDPASLDTEAVILVTRGINDLWRLSKSGDSLSGQRLEEINCHLHRWIPDRETYPYPLNLIIPAYETLWRVVAIGFVHTYLDEKPRRVFKELHDNASPKQFELGEPSAEFIIAEVLRLYPPTRHIGRTMTVPTRFSWNISSVLPSGVPRFFLPLLGRIIRNEMADVEAVQRSSVWEDADKFDAMRHQSSRCKPEQKETLLAFGFGPLKCIAHKWAPIAAAIILAAVLERVDNTEFRVRRGASIGGREGWDGWVLGRGDAKKGDA